LDNSITFDVHLLFTGKQDWATWSAAGRSYKGTDPAAVANHPNWDYYLLDPSSTIQGTGGMVNNMLLRLTRRPANGIYGLQIGLGANDQNGHLGLSSWFNFAGPTFSGVGDVNANGTFMNVPMPVSSVIYLPVMNSTMYQNDLGILSQKGATVTYEVSPPFRQGHPDGSPQHGQFSLQPTGAFNYTPHSSFAGVDRLYYQMVDPQNMIGGGKLIFNVNNVFPVTLTYFKGESGTHQEVLLSWGTSVEQNSHSFVVEKSLDGNSFERIGEVAASGNTSQNKSYHFVDESPAKGANYYRLMMVDIDNTTSYSDIIQVYLNETEERLLVSPNPAKDVLALTVKSFLGNTASVQVLDLTGKVVQSGLISFDTSGNSWISVGTVTPGLYVLTLQDETGLAYRARFVKE
jgi:hypothetical protein